MDRLRNENRWAAGLVSGILLCLCGGGCPRPEDALEPNNTIETATVLTSGVAVEGRVGQGNPDVFAIAAQAGRMIVFDLASLGGEDCAAFTVTAPGGAVLYDDGHFTCDPYREPQVRVEGAQMQRLGKAGYVLRAPATEAGTYFLTLIELGQADNIFTFSWDYRLTATLE